MAVDPLETPLQQVPRRGMQIPACHHHSRRHRQRQWRRWRQNERLGMRLMGGPRSPLDVGIVTVQEPRCLEAKLVVSSRCHSCRCQTQGQISSDLGHLGSCPLTLSLLQDLPFFPSNPSSPSCSSSSHHWLIRGTIPAQSPSAPTPIPRMGDVGNTSSSACSLQAARAT
jgi:hypothetical protein